MLKVKYFGYDIYELNYDLGSGELIETHSSTNKSDDFLNGRLAFSDIDSCLKFVSESCLGTRFNIADWNFEEDLDDKGNDGWVLHIIVERHTHEYATSTMIERWKYNKDGTPDLVDLLANVFVEEVK